ncbi:MAG TPA: RNase P subunit p30 family protein [Methanothrix sp.]|nr:RNase P subunit p30 family protein [Methanothrix sp.]HPT20131.1 RNase P subunit p30 family protein [Methanothrix sp.]
MSYYEIVRAFPESSASASRLALTARQLGYRGIIICNSDPGRIFGLQAAQMIKGIEVIVGAEVGRAGMGASRSGSGADASAAGPGRPSSHNGARAIKSRVASLRPKYPFLAVQGSSDETVRAAAEDPNVDMLHHPCESRRPLNIATARAARDNCLAVGFDLSPMIHLRGSSRARWMQSLRHNLDLAGKFRLTIMITMGASSHLDLRSPRDILALAEAAGFDPAAAEEALTQPGRIVNLNRRKWLGPGVELL